MAGMHPLFTTKAVHYYCMYITIVCTIVCTLLLYVHYYCMYYCMYIIIVCTLLLYVNYYCIIPYYRVLLPSFILLLMLSNNRKVINSKTHSFDGRSIVIATFMWSIIMVYAISNVYE